jgi:hypothetical protein
MTPMHVYQNPNAQKALCLLRKGMNMKPSSLRNTLLVAMLTFVMSAAFGQDHMAGVPGSLLWQDRFAGGEDTTARVAVDLGRTFTVGKGPATPGASIGWLVKAYDQSSGKVLWHDAIPGVQNKGQTVDTGSGLVFAGGTIIPSGTSSVGLVRAYDSATGALRWQDQITGGGFFAGVNWITYGNDLQNFTLIPLVYAVGREATADGSAESWLVRTYNALTGALQWQDVYLPADTFFDDATSVAVQSGRIFVSGFTFDTSSYRHFTVRSYDVHSGKLIWQEMLPGGLQGFYGSDAATQVVVDGNRVVAVGTVTDVNGYHFAVRAYDAASGQLIWSDLLNSGNGIDTANSVVLNAGRAYVVGYGGSACAFDSSSNCDWLIRAYDENTGTVIWKKEVDPFHQDDTANVVLACNDRVVVAGTAGTDTNAPYGDWLVQVLDARSGSLIWQDLLPTPVTYANPVGLGVSGSRLFVTGSIIDNSQSGDYIVRAYEFGSLLDSCLPISNNYGLR